MIQTIGSHKVKHGDVTKGITDLMQGDKAAIMYSDPPWGEGNIKYWATMNKKMNNEVNEPAPLQNFLDAVFGIARDYVTHYLLVEYGIQWRDEIIDRGRAAGFNHQEIVPLLYRSGSKLLPLDLHLFVRNGAPIPQGYTAKIKDTHGYETLKCAVPPLAALVPPNSIILDPCCGMGYTAQAAIDNNLIFRGNELNRKRLSKTIARLEKAKK